MRPLLIGLVVCLLAFGAAAGPKWVAGDALEVGKVYFLLHETPQHPPRAGLPVFLMAARSPIKVLRRVEHEGRPWYWTRWIRKRTLDRSEDREGWVDSRDLMAHDVEAAD